MTICQGLKADGRQCTRTTAPGSAYCWQHKKIYERKSPRRAKRSTAMNVYSQRITKRGNIPFKEDYNLALRQLKDKKWSLDSFQLIKKLGQGTFGIVYSAKEKSTGKTWVIKSISKKHTSENTVKREINILQRLKPYCEPYILCYENYFEDDNNYYVITEYLGNLVPLVTIVGKMDKWNGKINKIIINLIKGLMEIHKHSITHRDIKPENIMVDENGTSIKYIDFGSACYDGDCERRALEGTLIFMPPELLKDKLAEHNSVSRTLQQYQKADIWSLGLTIWELIIGESRFDHWEGYFLRKVAKEDPAGFQQLKDADPDVYDHNILSYYAQNFEYYVSGDWKIDDKVEKFLSQYKLTLRPMLLNDPNKRGFPVLPKA